MATVGARVSTACGDALLAGLRCCVDEGMKTFALISFAVLSAPVLLFAAMLFPLWEPA